MPTTKSLLFAISLVVGGCSVGRHQAAPSVSTQGTPDALFPARATAWRSTNTFEFLESGMPMSVVESRIGKPDRKIGSGQLSWEYDLYDGSEMIICPSWGTSADLSTWHVA